jgi:hypothetical protein
LLCQRCNFALGLLRDDPDLMRAAADYIEIHRARYKKAYGQTPAPTAAIVGRADGDSRPGEPPVGSDRRPGGRSTSMRITGRTSGSRRQTRAGEADE